MTSEELKDKVRKLSDNELINMFESMANLVYTMKLMPTGGCGDIKTAAEILAEVRDEKTRRGIGERNEGFAPIGVPVNPKQ